MPNHSDQNWKKDASAKGPGAARNAAPLLGIVEWFRVGEHERAERVIADMRRIGPGELRTAISWADWHTAEGREWYEWLIPRLASEIRLLPCLMYTPPSWGVAPKPSAPPVEPRSYADFLDLIVTQFGQHFEWVELWNEPNNLRSWDVTLDPYWFKFSSMIGGAAYWARQRGKKVALGGMNPIDHNWLKLMGDRGLLPFIDAVGAIGYPGPASASEGWKGPIERLRGVLQQFDSPAELWISETGYSTWRHDEHRQLTTFVEANEAPVQRVYWHAMHDLDPRLPTADGFHADERDYHFGLKGADGSAKLLYRLWSEGGLDAVKDAAHLGKSSHVSGNDKPVLITGGCGFIGTNLAHRILSSGRPVLLFDNLSRPGVERNLAWLRREHRDLLRFEAADVRDPHVVRGAVSRASQVFHFAAQVAVTTSLVNAMHDFEVNARGTLNVLEAIRAQDEPPPLVFTSTNKVYGGLADVGLRISGTRYEPQGDAVRRDGISEARPLDFHSPYGCSKGAADQYVCDYARTFGLPAVVFRMSCIYGPHQLGCEDQGWVAHFLLRAIKGDPITLYGDGKQVRDVLFVEDLVDAFLLAQEQMPAAGQAFNIGGGPENTISLLDLLDMIESLHGSRPRVRIGAWRPGDQRYYVSNTTKMRETTGWTPKVNAAEGVRRLYEWILSDDAAHRVRHRVARGHARVTDGKANAAGPVRPLGRKVSL